MKRFALAAVAASALAGAALTAPAQAEPAAYAFDKSHANVTFTVNHLGFSTVHGRFNDFDGTLMLDEENPSASSVSVTIPVESLATFWGPRDEHLKSPDFFNAAANPAITFASTSVEKTGDMTLAVTGDFTLLGVTKPVTLDVTVTKIAPNPMSGTKTVGFHATTTIKRTDFGMNTFVPAISDEVPVVIDFEATAQ
ncbi:MAG: polyisoprenoid-binding protein [Hyphomicrobiales bacterium]|nr:MAG: polyisoprenoid-binding protein [Hyphomicrobiales bacterium]